MKSVAIILLGLTSIFGSCNKNITVKMDGLQSYADSGIVSYHWFQVSGPATIVFDNPNNSVVNITGSSPVTGTYTIGLTVIDKRGISATGTATINVIK